MEKLLQKPRPAAVDQQRTSVELILELEQGLGLGPDSQQGEEGGRGQLAAGAAAVGGGGVPVLGRGETAWKMAFRKVMHFHLQMAAQNPKERRAKRLFVYCRILTVYKWMRV